MGGVSVPSQSWTQSLSPFSLEKGLRMKSHVSFWSFFFTAMLIDLIKLIEKTKCVSHPPLLLLCSTVTLNWPHHLFDIRPTPRRKMAYSTSFFERDIPNLWLLIMKRNTWSAVVDLCNDWLLSVSYARARMRKSLREVSDSNAQGPVRTTTKIEFGVCKKGEKFVITNFFVFVILFASKTRSVNYGLFNWPRCQNSSRS